MGPDPCYLTIPMCSLNGRIVGCARLILVLFCFVLLGHGFVIINFLEPAGNYKFTLVRAAVAGNYKFTLVRAAVLDQYSLNRAVFFSDFLHEAELLEGLKYVTLFYLLSKIQNWRFFALENYTVIPLF